MRAAVANHPKADALARVVRSAAWSAADEMRVRLSDGLAELVEDEQLGPDDGKVGQVDVLALLANDDRVSTSGRAVLSELLARGVALAPPGSIEDGRRLARRLSWLSARSYFDITTTITALAGEQRDRLLRGLAEVVRKVDARGAVQGRGKAFAALAALAASSSGLAAELRATTAEQVRDPLLRAALTHGATAPVAVPATPLAAEDAAAGAPASAPREGAAGELTSAAAPGPLQGPSVAQLGGRVVSAPLGPLALFFWCVTGLIWLRWLWRFVSGVLLRLRRPATLSVEASGVTVDAQTTLLGRTIAQRRTLLPLDNVARAVREVRYPRLALYAGLFALALGSYLGATLFLDGSSVGSPSMMALGAAVFGGGGLLDFVLSTLGPATRGRYTLLLYPRKGRAVALAIEAADDADALLRRLAQLSVAA